MDIDAINKLIQAVKASDISTLEVSDGDVRVRIERGTPVMAGVAQQQPVYAMQPAPPANAEERLGGDIEQNKSVMSPLVGIFRPLPEDRGVSIGAQLKKGTTVCYVEAMKLMNEIVMPENGTLVWIAAGDGDAVEFGQTLFHYR